ncbi:MAG: hypothetical protein FWG87_08060 [Defluviitaleaceae bacterium]|nr:hypothetical protein [Defluviitaleaceae bacterium]
MVTMKNRPQAKASAFETLTAIQKDVQCAIASGAAPMTDKEICEAIREINQEKRTALEKEREVLYRQEQVY